jgi:hypothetical protein
MSILSQVAPSIQVINVQKRRKLHVWPSDDRNGTIIDLTEISIPEKVMTSFEHQDLEKVTKALEYLQLTSHSMKDLSSAGCGLRKKAYFDYTQHYQHHQHRQTNSNTYTYGNMHN